MIAHGQPEYLETTLAALGAQTVACDRIFIVDTSSDDSCQSAINAFLSSNGNSVSIKADPESRLHESIAVAFEQIEPESNHWMWVLHDDSAPEPPALAEMLRTIEVSPSVAMVGPKLVHWDQPRIISQLGLSLTPLGNPINPYSSELDQGQHDSIDDVFAIGTAAALIRSNVYKEVEGLDPNAPALAADIDLSIRVRLAGHRVVLAPQAKVRHASLSLASKRPKSWLRAKPTAALRRATIHLRLTHSPLLLAILFWLLLDEIGLLRVIWHIAGKRPQLIWTEISSTIWGVFDIVKALRSRSLASRTRKLPFSSLKPLRANWPQVFASARKQADREESQAKLAAFAQSESDEEEKAPAKSFVAAGGLWLVFGLTLLTGLASVPTNIAIVGPGAKPLSATWLELFSNAGASFQQLGFGFAGPSDPFAWVLLFAGSLIFWAPSLGLALLVFFAHPLAFAGAWSFVAQFTDKAWARNISALAFSLAPAFIVAGSQAQIATLVVFIALPWLGFALSKAAGWGLASRTSTSTWTWIGAAGLLLATCAAASPSVGLVLLVVLGFTILWRFKRIGYLIWIGLPVAALFTPSVIFALAELRNPVALLADPAAMGGQDELSSVALLTGATGWFAFGWFAVLLVAIGALLTKRVRAATAFWVALISGLAGAWATGAVTQLSVNLDPAPLNSGPWLAVAALAAIGAMALALDSFKSAKFALPVFATLGLAPLLVMSIITPSAAFFTDGRVAPSIVAAEAASGSGLKTLSVSPSGNQGLSAEIIWGDGVHLDEQSVAYRYSLARSSDSAEDRVMLAELVANLASANGTAVLKPLNDLQIGYVMIPKSDTSVASELGLAFDSVPELEPIGATDFGRLWRVREAAANIKATEPEFNTLWSLTKAVQIAVLGSFVLLALPTRHRRRKSAQDSELFDTQFANEGN